MWIECRLPMWKVGSSNASLVKSMPEQIHIRHDKECLALYQDNVTEWDLHYEVTMSVYCQNK